MAQFGGKRQTNQLDARCRELENELEEERKRQTDSQKGTGEIVNSVFYNYENNVC